MRLPLLGITAGLIILVAQSGLFFDNYSHAAPAGKELSGDAGRSKLSKEVGLRKEVSEYSSSDFVVEGIVFHPDIVKRSVYIRRKGSDHGKILHVGDGVGSFRISVIEDSSVTLYHMNRILVLKLDRVELE